MRANSDKLFEDVWHTVVLSLPLCFEVFNEANRPMLCDKTSVKRFWALYVHRYVRTCVRDGGVCSGVHRLLCPFWILALDAVCNAVRDGVVSLL